MLTWNIRLKTIHFQLTINSLSFLLFYRISILSHICVRQSGLKEHLSSLQINKKLVYHRLRDTIGILTNGIHNATVLFAKDKNWQPLLYFAQGVVYLAPADYKMLEKEELSKFIWHQRIRIALGNKMLGGKIGFKRDGKGLKVAPQTLEFFQPGELIRRLPKVVEVKVRNINDPATPKRLDTLDLKETEKERLYKVADIRCDRLAESIILIQKEFLANCPEFIDWILNYLGLADKITPEQTQIQAGGVNRGWYYTAAHYIANHPTLNDLQIQEKLENLAEDLASWAEENNLLPEHHSPTETIFYSYLYRYLEVQGWQYTDNSFAAELNNYQVAKTKQAKVPICSLSSGEFASEDQLDSVVLFKPQQYSNKNALGSGKIKRGISKIWALEMLLRQAFWSARSGKFSDLQPVFLYIFPAYVYSPQVVGAIKILGDRLNNINLWDIRKTWINNDLNISALSSWDWLENVEAGGQTEDKYQSSQLPFMATIYTTTRGKTLTDAWDDEELILQGTGEIKRALDRQKVYKRPFLIDKSVKEYTTRQKQEETAIEMFMTTCVKELFGKMCKGDRALLQQYQNRFKSGVIIYYQKLARDSVNS